jgi:hypothetical protein
MKISAAMQNAALTAWVTALNPSTATVGIGSAITFYSGAAPASAHDAATGTKLLQVRATALGGGSDYNLLFDDPDSGVLVKRTSVTDTWNGTVAATGVAGYFRIHKHSDTDALAADAAQTKARIQGLVGSGAEAILSNPSLTSGATQAIDFLSITLPE